jgi:quercetin dioxygenase-like cupin family protein
MFSAEDSIKSLSYDKLQILKLEQNPNFEILCISLEKDALFPDHVSPNDATLIMLEGKIQFNINQQEIFLSKGQHLRFSKQVTHWVQAVDNSKFLIVR